VTDAGVALRGEEKPGPFQNLIGSVSGHGFNRAATAARSTWASAPAKPVRRPRLAASNIFAALLLALATTTGCHSYHVDTTVENRTGAPIQLLEVDYPSASFGADALAAGAIFHYRIQLQGSGPLQVQYTTGDERQIQISGPTLTERQEGELQIVLLPGGTAEFHPDLTPAR
jgi:hypothetical protein